MIIGGSIGYSIAMTFACEWKDADILQLHVKELALQSEIRTRAVALKITAMRSRQSMLPTSKNLDADHDAVGSRKSRFCSTMLMPRQETTASARADKSQLTKRLRASKSAFAKRIAWNKPIKEGF